MVASVAAKVLKGLVKSGRKSKRGRKSNKEKLRKRNNSPVNLEAPISPEPSEIMVILLAFESGSAISDATLGII